MKLVTSNMAIGWASDFSYEYFKKILQTIKGNFKLYLFSEILPKLKTNTNPKLLLRHDVDASLKRALRMAEIESELGIKATYLVMLDAELYSLETDESRHILSNLAGMKHEIGLHYDIDECERTDTIKIEALLPKIESACQRLQDIIGLPIKTVSFHCPPQQVIRGPLLIGNRINTYAKELMEWYLSDSSGNWREGEPLPKLLNPARPLLQLLIHPIWWGDKHKTAEERLQEFFESECADKPLENIRFFDTALATTIPNIKRRGYLNNK